MSETHEPEIHEHEPHGHRPAKAARRDARSPWLIDTRELSRRPGSMRKTQFVALAPGGWGVEMICVPAGAEVAVELRLEAVMEGVLASGVAGVPLAGECARCLEQVTDRTEVEFQELFAYGESTTSETTDDDETARLDGDLLDLEPVLRDAIVLALPLAPVCSPDCPGLCVVCGERRDDPAAHEHPVVDPRWASLATFGQNGSHVQPDASSAGSD